MPASASLAASESASDASSRRTLALFTRRCGRPAACSAASARAAPSTQPTRCSAVSGGSCAEARARRSRRLPPRMSGVTTHGGESAVPTATPTSSSRFSWRTRPAAASAASRASEATAREADGASTFTATARPSSTAPYTLLPPSPVPSSHWSLKPSVARDSSSTSNIVAPAILGAVRGVAAQARGGGSEAQSGPGAANTARGPPLGARTPGKRAGAPQALAAWA